jgi:pyridoxine kinase
VGNAATVFALQRLGAEVAAIHTVQFSNHPGHGAFTGRTYPAADTAALIQGLADHGTLPGCDALLTGYIGNTETGAAILDALALLRATRPSALWCCDPVMGDDGRLYVHAGLPAFFTDHAVRQADLLTPNQFELGLLAGQPVETLAQAHEAALAVRARMRPEGPRLVLVTSLRGADTAPDTLHMLLAAQSGAWLIATPLLPAKFSGAGDLLAALFLFHTLASADPVLAAERAAGSLAGILRRTWSDGAAELQLIPAQNELVAPSSMPAAAAFKLGQGACLAV